MYLSREDIEFRNRLLRQANLNLFTKEEEHELVGRAQKGDDLAKDQLVKGNVKLVLKIANDFYRYAYFMSSLSLSDLCQEGTIGFLEAVDKFDLSINNKLSTYSVWWIRQYIRRCIENKGALIHIPPGKRQLARKAFNELREKKISLNENGNLALVAFLNRQFPEASKDDIYTFILAVSTCANTPVSLSASFSDEEQAKKEIRKLELISFSRWQYSREPYSADLEKIEEFIEKWCREIDPQEKEVIDLCFGLNGNSGYLTIQEAAKFLDITYEVARQRLHKALRSLRTKAELFRVFLDAFPT